MLLAATMSVSAQTEARYPPLSAYLMPQQEEIALARSAAPANIWKHATIEVLTESGVSGRERG